MSVVTFTVAGRTRFTTAATGSLVGGIGEVTVAPRVVAESAWSPSLTEHADARTASRTRGTRRRRTYRPSFDGSGSYMVLSSHRPYRVRARTCRVVSKLCRRRATGAPKGAHRVRHRAQEGQASAPAGTSFLGSTNGITAVLPVSAPFSDSMSSVVPGSASSTGTQT